MKQILILYFVVVLSPWAIGQPSNDLCTGATSVLTDGTCYNGTTNSANDNIAGESGCATQGGPNSHRDVWFSFTATTSSVQFDITTSASQTIELLVLSGTCSSLSMQNSTCMTSPLNTTFAGFTIGQTYFYAVSFPGSAQNTFTSCVTSIAEPPNAGQNCTSAQPICSNSSFGGNSDGYGNQELTSANRGCLSSNERQSSWYYFQIQTSGTLDMTIDPTNSVDYDFALWGPMAAYTCPVATSPIRCSYASGLTTLLQTGSFNTGFGAAGTEASDGTSGTLNGWASTLNVLAGQYYILVIDNFSVDNTPFTLSWGGSAILSCAILMPVELSDFQVKPGSEFNAISWATLSELSNDYFTVQRSTDGSQFENVIEISGAGNSSEKRFYNYNDKTFEKSVTNYYRLKQTDFNGDFSYSPVIAVDNHSERKVIAKYAIDMTGKKHDINSTLSGLFLVVTEYDDFTTETKKVHIQH